MRIRPGREPTHAGVSGIYSVFELSESAVALVLGAVVLISIAPFWFDGRVPVRTYTTARRYYTGLFAYMLAVLILYGGLWFLLNKTIFRPSPVAAATIREATTIATTGLHVDPGADPRAKSVSWIAAQRLLGRAEAADLDSQLLKIASVLVALLLVVMVAPLALLPTAVRRILHRLIGVPAAAERLADQLVRSNPSTPTDVVAEVALLLRRRGYDPDEAWLPVAEPMRALWFKTALLYHEARRWADDPHYRGFVLTASHEFDVLRQSFDQLSLKVVRVLDTVEHLGALLPAATPEKTPATAAAVSPSDSAKTIRNIVTDVLADLREDIAFLLSNVCLFIARCVLAQSLTANGRRRRLAKLGFQLESEPRSALQFFLWAWVAYVLIYVAARPIPMSMAVMIATIQVVALATAIVPNLRFGFACEDLYGRTPWRFVVASGVVAAVLFVPIVLGHPGNDETSPDGVRRKLPMVFDRLYNRCDDFLPDPGQPLVTASLQSRPARRRWAGHGSRHGRWRPREPLAPHRARWASPALDRMGIHCVIDRQRATHRLDGPVPVSPRAARQAARPSRRGA
jgi:hypothetical protein